MKKTLKILSLILAVMMIMSVMAACGDDDSKTSDKSDKKSAKTPEDTVTPEVNLSDMEIEDFGSETGANLTVWVPSDIVSLTQQQCDSFAEKFSDKKIKITVKEMSESAASESVLLDPANSADVFSFPCDKLGELAKYNRIVKVPLKYAENINATNLEAAVEASSSDGALCAYPETLLGYYLVYDKKVVSDADAGSFENILKACKNAGKKFVMNAGSGYYACIFLFTGGLRTEGLTEDGKQAFNSYDTEKVTASMRAFSKLIHEYKGTFISDDPSRICSGFSSTSSKASTVGAGIDGIWNAKNDAMALGEDYGAAKLPTINIDGIDTQMVSMLGCKMLGVNSSTKYPRTATILANFLSGEECQTARAAESSWVPTNMMAISDASVMINPSMSALLSQSQFSVPQVNLRTTFWDPVGAVGRTLNADDTDPDNYNFQELLEKTITEINSK